MEDTKEKEAAVGQNDEAILKSLREYLETHYEDMEAQLDPKHADHPTDWEDYSLLLGKTFVLEDLKALMESNRCRHTVRRGQLKPPSWKLRLKPR